MKKSILLSLLIAVFASSALLASPRVTQYPKTLVPYATPVSTSVTINWDDGTGSPYPATETAKIIYGVSPQNYYGTIPQSSSGSATFTPNTSGMTGGVYYCRISDNYSNETSPEFVLYIQGSTSVQMTSPANAAALDTLAPQFNWDPVAGTPFYTILVFDTQATINFSSGYLSITANVIWGATTDQQSITYGTPDPSGYFSKLDPPPLMQGSTYSWIVLNNYDGTPAMMANNVGGTRMFTVNPVAACTAATLTAPLNNVTITAQPIPVPITLNWTAGTGVNNYKIVLMKNLTGDTQGAFGSGTVLLWSGYTPGTQIDIPINIAMNDGWYQWYVIALDSAGRGMKSAVWDFHYVPNPGDIPVEIQINEKTSNPTGVTSVPNVVVFIGTTGGGDVNIYPMIASDTGGFYLDMQAADYEFSLKKTGFVNATFSAQVTGPSSVTFVAAPFIMERCKFAIRGVVKDDHGNTVGGAKVTASLSGDSYVVNTIGDGSFVVYVGNSGGWNVNVTMAGYQQANVNAPVPSGTLAVTEYVLPAAVIITKNVSTVSGKVTNNSGQGIFDAQVVVNESGNPSNAYPVDTDSSGNYLVNLPNGVWVVNVTKAGFVSPPTAGVTTSGMTAYVCDFTMQARADTISGRVIDNNNNAMQGVTVTAVSAGNPTVLAITDVSGNYTLSVGTWSYNVNAVLSGWQYFGASTQIVVSFASPGLTSVNNNFTLFNTGIQANASALISVLAGVTAVPGASVTLTGNQAATLGFLGSGITDAQGSITITALAAGQYALTVVKTGYNTFYNGAVSLFNSTITPVTASMSVNASTGTIAGTTGVGSSTIQIYDQANPGTALYTLTTDGTGGYTSASISYGNYIVNAYKSGYSSSPQQLYAALAGAASTGNNFTLTAASGGGILIMAPSVPIYNENIGGPYQFTAAYIDGLGNNVYAVFAWSVAPAAGGVISATGVFTPTSDYIGPITINAAALNTIGYSTVPVYQKINPSYAAVTVKDYAGLILSIPANAASASNSIDRFTMAKTDVDRSRSNTTTKRVVGKVYNLTSGFAFNSNLTLTLPITAGQGIGTEKIGLWDGPNNTWDDIGGTVTGGAVYTTITHFSEYTVLAALGSIGLAYNENTPNPFSPDKGPILIKYVTDSKVASSVKTTIKVFNMAGKFIRTILDKALRPVGIPYTDSWDGKDERGRVCLNGRYFLQIEVEDSSGKKQKIYSIALVK